METYEQKYKEALERARLLKLANPDDEAIQTFVKDSFPELKESEDERIRKELLAVINDLVLPDEQQARFNAWLEKQKVNTEGDFGRGYDCGYKACLNSHGAEFFEKQKEQKPAEWSLEDEAIISCIVCCLDGQFVTEAARKQCLEWFNKHRKDFLNQPKQELSEEDEEMLNSCISSIEESKENRYAYRENDGDTSYDREIAWLKSLKDRGNFPKSNTNSPSEWTEEDEAMRDNILRLLSCFVGTSECELNPSLSTSYPAYQKEIDWLKSLRPQPHWKPSKEQMTTLLRAEGVVRVHDTKELAAAIAQLYEQLKKLM